MRRLKNASASSDGAFASGKNWLMLASAQPRQIFFPHIAGNGSTGILDHPARAFISNYQELGFYKDGALIMLSPKQQAEAFTIDPATYEAKQTNIDPALEQQAIAYYQTASVAYKRGHLKERAGSF